MGKIYSYPAKVVKDGEFSVISFRDIPEAITQVDQSEDLNEWARDALITAISMYFDDGNLIPPASKPKKGEVVIDLQPSLVAKIILHNTMIENRQRQADIARVMGIPTSEVARIVNPKYKTKIDTLANAIQAAGGKLILTSE